MLWVAGGWGVGRKEWGIRSMEVFGLFLWRIFRRFWNALLFRILGLVGGFLGVLFET